MSEQKKKLRQKITELLEWMDEISFRHPGRLVAFDLIMLAIIIICTAINLKRL